MHSRLEALFVHQRAIQRCNDAAIWDLKDKFCMAAAKSDAEEFHSYKVIFVK